VLRERFHVIKIYAMCFTESYETINHYHLREAVNSELGHRTSAALVDCKNRIYRKCLDR